MGYASSCLKKIKRDGSNIFIQKFNHLNVIRKTVKLCESSIKTGSKNTFYDKIQMNIFATLECIDLYWHIHAKNIKDQPKCLKKIKQNSLNSYCLPLCQCTRNSCIADIYV